MRPQKNGVKEKNTSAYPTKVIVEIAMPPLTGGSSLFNLYVALSRNSGRDTIRLLRDFNEKTQRWYGQVVAIECLEIGMTKYIHSCEMMPLAAGRPMRGN